MTRFALAVLSLAFTANIVAAPQTSPAPPAEPKAAAATPASAQTIRKLSRRERKDRIAKLSEKHRQFLTDVEPIMHQAELDTFLLLETEPQRDLYIDEFWRRRDRHQGTNGMAYRDEYYARLDESKEEFGQVSSDRARIFLMYGPPADRLKSNCDRYLQPLEIWTYAFIPGIGHDVRLLFYIPRHLRDYKFWNALGDDEMALGELISVDALGKSMTGGAAVNDVFSESASPVGNISKIEVDCPRGDEILRAIYGTRQNKTQLLSLFEPPPAGSDEDVRKILRSVVLANPNAPKLTADFAVRFPAKQGARTDAEMTILVPRSQLSTKEVGGAVVYSVDVTGEVLRDGQLYENYRYRFDFPGTETSEKLPILVDRFLRPDTYTARIKVLDVHSGAEAVIEKELVVPELLDTAEQRAAKDAANATIAQLKNEIVSGETKLRIVPPPDELLSGIQTIETLLTGDQVKAVEFWLDGKKIAVKRNPPFVLDLDFGQVPQVRRVRVVGLDDKGEILTGDDMVFNTGNEPFRVRISSPRIAHNLRGKQRVEVDVRVPEGKEVSAVELYWNETRVATMYNAPFVQTVTIPATEGVGYIRATATLKDDETPAVEDVVMVNTPQFMEEVNVHLVELPTTVFSGGKPVNNLAEAAFKVTDEGKPVKISKFEHVSNLPLSLGLAIDTSGSMQQRMAEAQKAGAEFFQKTMKTGDKAFLVEFNTEPHLVQKWSPKLADVHAGLAKLRAEESTALYDAVVYSLYNFLGVKGQKALVLLSDGKDTSSKFTFDQALEYAKRAAVPIYTIGLGIRSTEVDVRYKLNKLSTETGGTTYYIESAADLRRIYDDIQEELRSQYVLGFYPPEGVKPGGKWREVSVQATGGKAKTIRGYYP
ncbi:MAG TPA: VWA domain-containing protein [Thermoanaerobaculia bacterium]|jgi:Ca-activated chloride channel family protein